MPTNDGEVRQEIKLVLELTARVDERVKLVVEKQSEMTSRLNSFIDAHNSLSSRVSVIEAKGGNGIGDIRAKVESLAERIAKLEGTPSAMTTRWEILEEDLSATHDEMKTARGDMASMQGQLTKIAEHNDGLWTRLKGLADLGVKAAWVVFVCWILYRLGLNAPPIP